MEAPGPLFFKSVAQPGWSPGLWSPPAHPTPCPSTPTLPPSKSLLHFMQMGSGHLNLVSASS